VSRASSPASGRSRANPNRPQRIADLQIVPALLVVDFEIRDGRHQLRIQFDEALAAIDETVLEEAD